MGSLRAPFFPPKGVRSRSVSTVAHLTRRSAPEEHPRVVTTPSETDSPDVRPGTGLRDDGGIHLSAKTRGR